MTGGRSKGCSPRLSTREAPLLEQLPRNINIDIFEREVGSKLYVFQQCNDIYIGDRLTDNAAEPDEHRFHDVFHYAYCAVLTWSPVTRALFRLRRRARRGASCLGRRLNSRGLQPAFRALSTPLKSPKTPARDLVYTDYFQNMSQGFPSASIRATPAPKPKSDLR